MSLINDMKAAAQAQHVNGQCANCHVEVWEALWLLDDAYNVWVGRCPGCKALNFLSMRHGLRGYTSTAMQHLVLPTLEEIDANGFPKDTPTAGKGGPANAHGSPAGELMHRLTEGS